MYTNDMNPVSMMRYLEYHYLMGFTDAIAFDNTCNNNSIRSGKSVTSLC